MRYKISHFLQGDVLVGSKLTRNLNSRLLHVVSGGKKKSTVKREGIEVSAALTCVVRTLCPELYPEKVLVAVARQ